MEYFRIKNWEKYQHRDAIRGHGSMSWIRVQVDILDDPKLFHLSEHDRLTWILLLLYSGRTRNRLKRDSAYIKHQLHLKWLPNLALFEELGLIETFDASSLPADCQPREEKRTAEQEKRGPAAQHMTSEKTTAKPEYFPPQKQTFKPSSFRENPAERRLKNNLSAARSLMDEEP